MNINKKRKQHTHKNKLKTIQRLNQKNLTFLYFKYSLYNSFLSAFKAKPNNINNAL